MKCQKLLDKVDKNKLPVHIAVIMDGNGRWAKRRALPKIMGHRQGVKTVKKIVRACSELGVKVLTLYTFSTENWKRKEEEVRELMSLLLWTIQKEVKALDRNNVKVIISGDLKKFGSRLQKTLKDSVNLTEKNNGLVLNIALNYGARQELVQACRRIAKKVIDGKLKVEDIDERLLEEHLYTAGLPDPDLLIRTSGELRVSNFMLYQIAYTEIYSTRVLWPDFNEDDLYEAIIDFQKRERRFGSLG